MPILSGTRSDSHHWGASRARCSQASPESATRNNSPISISPPPRGISSAPHAASAGSTLAINTGPNGRTPPARAAIPHHAPPRKLRIVASYVAQTVAASACHSTGPNSTVTHAASAGNRPANPSSIAERGGVVIEPTKNEAIKRNAADLASIVRPSVAVVIGAGGGLGHAFAHALAGVGFSTVYALSRTGTAIEGCVAGQIDVTNETTIAAAAARVDGPLGLVVVATGILHGDGVAPEKSWRMIEPQAFTHVLAINTIGPALVAKHFLPLFQRKGRAVFAALSARVGSIGDNRAGGWHAYRASKAALNMLIANFAIELRARNPDALAVGLHPGTVNTGLSQPFQRGVQPEKLFTPEFSAGQLLDVVDKLTPADSGYCFAWDGTRIVP